MNTIDISGLYTPKKVSLENYNLFYKNKCQGKPLETSEIYIIESYIKIYVTKLNINRH